MKRYILLISFIIMVSCSDMTVTEEKDCEVSFHLSGDIITSDTPLTKSLNNNDLLLVQVYRGNNAFACGIFDNLDEMRLNLKQGNDKYRIIFALVKNGKELLGEYYDSALNTISNAWYSSIFFHLEGSAAGESMVINEFWYNSVRKYHYYDYLGYHEGERSLELTRIGTSSFYINNSYYDTRDNPVLCDDWFYGETTDYSPNGTSDIISIDLIRTGFKLKYQVSGITDGEVDISISQLLSNTISSSTYSSEVCFYSFNDVRSAWLYPDDYSQNFVVSVVWRRGIGVTQDLGSKTIQLKRNCLNNININLGNNDQSAGMNLTVESESTIGAETVMISVE